jgi:hypothetical protein
MFEGTWVLNRDGRWKTQPWGSEGENFDSWGNFGVDFEYVVGSD